MQFSAKIALTKYPGETSSSKWPYSFLKKSYNLNPKRTWPQGSIFSDTACANSNSHSLKNGITFFENLPRNFHFSTEIFRDLLEKSKLQKSHAGRKNHIHWLQFDTGLVFQLFVKKDYGHFEKCATLKKLHLRFLPENVSEMANSHFFVCFWRKLIKRENLVNKLVWLVFWLIF